MNTDQRLLADLAHPLAVRTIYPTQAWAEAIKLCADVTELPLDICAEKLGIFYDHLEAQHPHPHRLLEFLNLCSNESGHSCHDLLLSLTSSQPMDPAWRAAAQPPTLQLA